MSKREAQYLLAILQAGEGEVRSVDLAQRLGVQKSSVSAMLSRLSAQGLVSKEFYGRVSLTETGRAEALRLRNILRETESYLIRTLGLDGDCLESVALAMVLAGGSQIHEALQAR